MPSLPRACRASLVAALLVCAALAAPRAALAHRAPPPPARIIPNVGPLYDVLGAGFWRYALGRPTPVSPFTDDGTHCAEGQAGPVFYLAGVLGGSPDPVERACVVRGPRALFFPISNAFDVHTPGDGLDTPAAVWADFQRGRAAAGSLSASVDGLALPVGAPVRTSRLFSCVGLDPGCFPRAFGLELPDDSVLDALVPGGLDPGRYYPAVQDGWYVLLAPLSPGPHTVKFGATKPDGTVSQDITYHLTVTR